MRTVGDYELLECVGEGSAGTVYKGRHQTTGQIVAIKVMSIKWAANAMLVQRFEREFQAARSLNHPNLVRALDFGQLGEQPYLVMEFIEGQTLGARLEAQVRLPEAEAIQLIEQIGRALHAAHQQGLIHRDIKPDNILITPDNRAILTDLGLVKQLTAESDLTRTGRGLGTPNFMAPEQFQDAKNADVRCDVYALAATLYQMVTGKLPFEEETPLAVWRKKVIGDMIPPRKHVPELSARTEQVIRRSMSPGPDHRPASCLEFLLDLGADPARLTSVDPGNAEQGPTKGDGAAMPDTTPFPQEQAATAAPAEPRPLCGPNDKTLHIGPRCDSHSPSASVSAATLPHWLAWTILAVLIGTTAVVGYFLR
jgi:serine/threonine protein kinase